MWGTAYRFTPCRRDGHKKGWLESYKGKDGIAKIHAFGQLENGKQYLKDMLNEPPVTHTVEISWGNRHNVGSKDNPFIKREKEMYTETLHPQVVCPRSHDTPLDIFCAQREDETTRISGLIATQPLRSAINHSCFMQLRPRV